MQIHRGDHVYPPYAEDPPVQLQIQLDRVQDRSERTLMIDLRSDTYNEMYRENYTKLEPDQSRVNTFNQERAPLIRVHKTTLYSYINIYG